MVQEGKTKKIFDGRYEIVGIVGRGPCSVVYHARHVTPPTTDIALKVLTPDKSGISQSDRLRKEALAMISAKHRYVIGLQDYHSVGTLSYLAMDFASESDLRSFMTKKGGKLSPSQGERFLLQTAEALASIHRAGITHRDIKPDNILVMSDVEIRLADFGVSILPGELSNLDDLQRGVGTMDYMAPEVLESERYDQSSDVYALALTFYEVLSGQHPFANIPLMEQLEARKDGKITNLSILSDEVPLYVSSAIMKGLRYNSEDRYPNAREFLQAILLGKSGAIEIEEPVAISQAEETIEASEPEEISQNEVTEPIQEPQEIQEDTSSSLEAAYAEPEAGIKIEPEIAAPEELPVVNNELHEEEKAPTPPTPPSSIASQIFESAPVVNKIEERQRDVQEEDDAPRSSGAQLRGLKPKSQAPLNPFMMQHSVEASATPFDASQDVRSTVSVPPEDIGLVRQSHEDRMTISLSPEAGSTLSERLQEGEIEGMNGKFSIRDGRSSKISETTTTSRLLDGKTLKKALLGVIGIAGIVILSGVLFSRDLADKHSSNNKETKVSSQSIEVKEELKLADTVLFPAIPQGIYAGEIADLLPGTSFNLTLVSLADQGVMGVIIGLPGFTPAQFKLPAEGSDKLRIVSNGMILDLSAVVKDGILSGTYKNIIEGTSGTWSARAISLGGE